MLGGFHACAHRAQIVFSQPDCGGRKFRLKVRVGKSAFAFRGNVEGADEHRSAGLQLGRKEVSCHKIGCVAPVCRFQGTAQLNQTRRRGAVILAGGELAHGQNPILPASLDGGAGQLQPEDGHGIGVQCPFNGWMGDRACDSDVAVEVSLHRRSHSELPKNRGDGRTREGRAERHGSFRRQAADRALGHDLLAHPRKLRALDLDLPWPVVCLEFQLDAVPAIEIESAALEMHRGGRRFERSTQGRSPTRRSIQSGDRAVPAGRSRTSSNWLPSCARLAMLPLNVPATA